jgi:hypothetical protein
MEGTQHLEIRGWQRIGCIKLAALKTGLYCILSSTIPKIREYRQNLGCVSAVNFVGTSLPIVPLILVPTFVQDCQRLFCK